MFHRCLKRRLRAPATTAERGRNNGFRRRRCFAVFFRSFSFPYSVYIPLVGHAFTEQQTNTFDGSSSLRPETETERSVVLTVHEWNIHHVWVSFFSTLSNVHCHFAMRVWTSASACIVSGFRHVALNVAPGICRPRVLPEFRTTQGMLQCYIFSTQMLQYLSLTITAAVK